MKGFKEVGEGWILTQVSLWNIVNDEEEDILEDLAFRISRRHGGRSVTIEIEVKGV